MTKTNKIIYWVTTTLLALGMLAGSIGQLMHNEQQDAGTAHLGYPLYLMNILGIWKILGVIALLMPKFPLIKEWAYAGFFFAMTGAVISHITSGDSFGQFIAPLIFSLLTVVSWYYRPADRRIIFETK